jgi:hypothetical protein
MSGSPDGYNFDGLFDFIEGESQDCSAPVYVHQVQSYVRLTLAEDGCWHVRHQFEDRPGKAMHELRSSPVMPGMPPQAAAAWQNLDRNHDGDRNWADAKLVKFNFADEPPSRSS